MLAAEPHFVVEHIADRRALAVEVLAAEAPCDGCEHRTRCGERALACRQFLEFVHRGGTAWRKVGTERRPTRAIYRAAFRDADADECLAAAPVPPEPLTEVASYAQ